MILNDEQLDALREAMQKFDRAPLRNCEREQYESELTDVALSIVPKLLAFYEAYQWIPVGERLPLMVTIQSHWESAEVQVYYPDYRDSAPILVIDKLWSKDGETKTWRQCGNFPTHWREIDLPETEEGS